MEVHANRSISVTVDSFLVSSVIADFGLQRLDRDHMDRVPPECHVFCLGLQASGNNLLHVLIRNVLDYDLCSILTV